MIDPAKVDGTARLKAGPGPLIRTATLAARYTSIFWWRLQNYDCHAGGYSPLVILITLRERHSFWTVMEEPDLFGHFSTYILAGLFSQTGRFLSCR